MRDKGIKDLNFDKIFYYEYEMPVERKFEKGNVRIKKPNSDLEEVPDSVEKRDRHHNSMIEESY